MDVKGGRALVTGGAQGIGRAVCEALLSKGCKVCCVDVNSEKGKKTVEELQKIYGESNCMFAKCDVSSLEEFQEAYLKAKEYFGNLNILINNAGVVMGDKIVDINLKGAINGCDIALKYMGKNNGGDGGAVVNISSIAAVQVFSSLPIYSASKAGVLALTRCYGQQEHYEKSRIKFTALCPCSVNTDMYKEVGEDEAVEKGMRVSRQNNPPMAPSEAAEGIIQLIEDGKNGAAMVIKKDEENKYIKLSEEVYMN